MATAPERAADYHADPEPRLSSTIARQLILRTPAHAKAALDGRTLPESEAMTVGTAVHQCLLRDDRVDVLPYDNYKTKAAQEARDVSRALGRVPILSHKWDEARLIAEHVNGQILNAGYDPTPFTKGSAEVVLRWSENGADCRALLDWLRDDLDTIDDLKTTNDASPAKFRRHVFNMGYDIQAAFYCRAVKKATDYVTDDAVNLYPEFRWVVVETKPPYPVAVYQLSDRAMASAQVKVDTAIQLWNECMASGVWPAYPAHVHEVDIPGWASDEADQWGDVDDALEQVPF